MHGTRRTGWVVATALVALVGLAAGSGAAEGVSAAGAGGAPMPTTARGVVRAVSATRLVVRVGEGGGARDLALVVGEKTPVLRGRQVLAPADLRPGDPVTVSYYVTEHGRAMARRIWIRVERPEPVVGSDRAPAR